MARLDAAWAAWPLLQVAHGPQFLGGFPAECTGTSTCTDVSSKEAQYVNSFFRGFKLGTINRFVYRVRWYIGDSAQMKILPRPTFVDGQKQRAEPVILTEARISAYFSMPMSEAARQLGVCETSLKG